MAKQQVKSQEQRDRENANARKRYAERKAEMAAKGLSPTGKPLTKDGAYKDATKRPRNRPWSTTAKSGVNASTSGGNEEPKRAARAEIDWTNWREFVRAGKVKLTDDMKSMALEAIAGSGFLTTGAHAAGVTTPTLKSHMEKDPEFRDAIEAAQVGWAMQVLDTAKLLAVHGYDEPVYGGKFKDEQVGTKKVFATNILAMWLKKVDPEFRERQEVSLTAEGGVLLAPAEQQDPASWAKQWGKPKPDGELDDPTRGDGEMANVTR